MSENKIKLTKDQKELQIDLLKLLTPGKKIMITTLLKDLPEIKGDFAIYMPVNKGINENILWINGVSKDFITVFNNLLVDLKLITWNPEHIITYLLTESPIYSKPQITTEKQLKSQTVCWLPISIQLNLQINKTAKKNTTTKHRKIKINNK